MHSAALALLEYVAVLGLHVSVWLLWDGLCVNVVQLFVCMWL